MKHSGLPDAKYIIARSLEPRMYMSFLFLESRAGSISEKRDIGGERYKRNKRERDLRDIEGG